MSNGLKIKNSTATVIIVIGIFALGIILACVPRVQTPLTVSSAQAQLLLLHRNLAGGG